MSRSLAAKIEEANSMLLADGMLDAIGEYFAKNYVAHLTDKDMERGHAAIRRFLGAYRHSFSDFQVEVEILMKSKDRVAWQRTILAMHVLPFQGFPATGRRLVWRDMVVSRFRDGLIAEDWVITDLAERLLRARKR